MSDDTHEELLGYLQARLKMSKATATRQERLKRYASIDRLISTWQKLNQKDSMRLAEENHSGRQYALPMNLPLLATHLEDMTAFFAEVFAPMNGGFYSSSGDENYINLAKKLNNDSQARGYYAQVCLAIRSLLKYNIGGCHLEWDDTGKQGVDIASPGNRWTALDMYNTIWDPTVSDVSKVSTEAEWAAIVEIKNRLWLLKKGLTGEYSRLNEVLDSEESNNSKQSTIQPKGLKLYCSPVSKANMSSDGTDSTSSKGSKKSGNEINWADYNLGDSSTGLIDAENGYEVVTMYCWIRPSEYGLVSDQELRELASLGIEVDSFIELWKFTLVNSAVVVAAEPLIPREEMSSRLKDTLVGATAGVNGRVIPIFLSHMTQDQMKEAQRSMMELMRGFQRFSSYLLNVYIAGMRKNVWGITVVDPSMFDTTQLEEGDVAGIYKSKVPGMDVRTGLHKQDTSTGVEGAISALGSTLELTNKLFPAQAAPSQIAGIDRAVKSQVSTVMAGAMRRLHMTARILESSLFRPTMVEAYRNIARYDSETVSEISDEDVAQLLGTGLESLEAERVSEVLTDLMQAALQSREGQQTFDFNKLLSYISKVKNLTTDLGQFVRQQPQEGNAGGQPGGNQPSEPATAQGGDTGITEDMRQFMLAQNSRSNSGME
jgi:hypothetical protein